MPSARSVPPWRREPSAGTGASPAPVPRPFWAAWAALLVASAAQWPLGSNGVLAAAAALMLLGGLPHGAFDLALAQRALRLGGLSAAGLLSAYLGVGGIMIALWSAWPVPALGLFLALSAVHFGDDWAMLESRLLRTMAGAALLCVTAFAHPQDVSALFVAMAGPGADWVRRALVALTPVALLVTLVGMAQAVRIGASAWALAQLAALLALAMLPPQLGFLLYFVFLHSPLHLRRLGRCLDDWSKTRLWGYGSALCAMCLVPAAVLAPGLVSGKALAMAADGFRLLSAVAAPHLVLGLVVARSGRFAPPGGQGPRPDSRSAVDLRSVPAIRRRARPARAGRAD